MKASQSVPWEFGNLVLHASETHLTAIDFRGEACTAPGNAVLQAACAQMEAYLAGDLKSFDLPLAPEGTDFERQVWDALQLIPYGTTTTYGDLAEELGLGKGASRAVGGANGRNPIPIIIPCHRVIGTRGLTGFGGGLDAKAWLLAHEGAILF